MSSDSATSTDNEQQQQEEEAVVAVQEENIEIESKDEGDNGNAGTNTDGDDSASFTEPAPPSYEEALTLYMRDAERGDNKASSSRSRRSSGGRGRRGQNLHDDHELAVRLQREEIAQARGRSASLSAGPSSVGRRGDANRVSVSSAPGDLRHGSEGHRPQHQRPRLRSIPENEEMIINDSTSHSEHSSNCTGGACCYYSCFGFTNFTNRLSPTLRVAWKQGLKQITKTAIPVFGTQPRYFLFSLQALVTTVCIILSFASTPLSGENVVRNISLIVCLVVNITERVISWCGCCQSKQTTYNAYSDITRNLLTDILLYPAVIASIMNILHTKSYNVVVSLWNESIYNVSNAGKALQDDAINFSMNVLVITLFVVMVYCLRFWQLVRIVRSLLREFKKNVSGAHSAARVFIVVFLMHALIQSLVQIMYILLIGYRIQRELSEESSTNLQVFGVSVYLFIMMVCGGLVPLIGTFMYFITTQKWAEEVSIAFLLDHNPSDPSDVLSEDIDHVEQEFKILHQNNTRCSGCLFGIIHPLVSPLQMLLAITYFALWVLFVATYPITALDSVQLNLSLSDPSHGFIVLLGAAILYGLVIILSLLANILPLAYGLIGVAILPFWALFYAFIGCLQSCKRKS